MEPDKSPGGVDGRFPASTWVKVVTETWQVGLGGRGVDGEPLQVASVSRGSDREQNTHVVSESASRSWPFGGIRIQQRLDKVFGLRFLSQYVSNE